jgi:hypothetical protein
MEANAVLQFSGGFIAASFATEFWHLVLTQGILVGYVFEQSQRSMHS